jgi:hypothetical protein
MIEVIFLATDDELEEFNRSVSAGGNYAPSEKVFTTSGVTYVVS